MRVLSDIMMFTIICIILIGCHDTVLFTPPSYVADYAGVVEIGYKPNSESLFSHMPISFYFTDTRIIGYVVVTGSDTTRYDFASDYVLNEKGDSITFDPIGPINSFHINEVLILEGTYYFRFDNGSLFMGQENAANQKTIGINVTEIGD
nr:hypothetical protein [candidate division Zixibacteria bacterium]